MTGPVRVLDTLSLMLNASGLLVPIDINVNARQGTIDGDASQLRFYFCTQNKKHMKIILLLGRHSQYIVVISEWCGCNSFEWFDIFLYFYLVYFDMKVVKLNEYKRV